MPAKPIEQPRPTYVPRSGDNEQSKIEEALNAISPVCPYDEWKDIGMALHSTGAAWAYTAWGTWSARAGEEIHSQRETAAKWASFKREGLTIATLFMYAQKAGWKDRTRAVPDMTRGYVSSKRADMARTFASNRPSAMSRDEEIAAARLYAKNKR